MKIACYKDRTDKKRLIRYEVTVDEYDHFNLGGDNFQTVLHDDGTIELRRSKYQGSKWGKHGSGLYQLQHRVQHHNMPIFGAIQVPESEIGNPEDEVLAMIDTSKLKLRQVRGQPKNTNGTHKPVQAPAPTKLQQQLHQPNPKIMRKVHELLGDYFDENAGKYRSGYSDDKVAKEANCSIVFVQRQREEAYGKLAPDVDTRLKQIAYTLETIRDNIIVHLEDLHKMQMKLEELFKEQQKR